MAEYRYVHTKIWRNPWFRRLCPERKVVYQYLFTNEHASLSGIYCLLFEDICTETALDAATVRATLDYFKTTDHVSYDGRVMFVHLMREYQALNMHSPKIQACINNDLEAVPESRIKRKYRQVYGMDTISIQHGSTDDGVRSTDDGVRKPGKDPPNPPTDDPVLIALYEIPGYKPNPANEAQVLGKLRKVASEEIFVRAAEDMESTIRYSDSKKKKPTPTLATYRNWVLKRVEWEKEKDKAERKSNGWH